MRFSCGGRTGYGVYGGGCVRALSWEPFEKTANSEPLDVSEVRLLVPVVPSKIVAVGLNYADHAEELGLDVPEEPIIFLKSPETLLENGGDVVYPEQSSRVDYEAELAVVMGARAKDVDRESALEHVLGYTCGLDMTARDIQMKDIQWTRAKNFDTFCPLGPWVETDLDPADLGIELRLNGEVRQSSRTSSLIFDVAFLVSFISSIMTLEPGDVVLTGTPPGVGEVSRGDRIEVTIEGIGTLACAVSSQAGGN